MTATEFGIILLSRRSFIVREQLKDHKGGKERHCHVIKMTPDSRDGADPINIHWSEI